MKKIFTTLLLTLGMATAAHATFPVRRTIVHQQPNGTQLTLTSVSNGRYTLYTTADGRAVLPAADGHYYYAVQTADGNMVATQQLAANKLSKTIRNAASLLTSVQAAELLNELNPSTPLLRLNTPAASARALATSTADGLGQYGKSASGAVKSIGHPTLPVVMVNFADRAFQDTITTTKVERFFNEEGYHDEPAARGSVRDFFTAQSNGAFQPNFKVVANVTLSNGYAYYGKDGSNGSIDPNINTFVREALAEASKTANFSDFCEEGTNEVPMVILMFAGPGQQSSFEDGQTNYLWAKFSQSAFSVNEGASKVRSYFIGNELLQNYGKNENDIVSTYMDGVGLFCHEFSHALGLPDFYNTKNSRSFATMGYWDLLDYGQYYQNGYRPVEYSAYERSYMGWLDVKELGDEAQHATLLPLDGSQGDNQPRAYVLRNPNNDKEYYLLENRVKNDWHGAMMGSGLFITHVDYDAAVWGSNKVNTEEAHQRMQFVPADNIKEGTTTSASMSFAQLFEGIRNDLFPCTIGGELHNAFTDDTTPAATLFTGDKLQRPIYNITQQANGTITFSYLDANLTGINTITTTQPTSSAAVYDLQGRRHASLSTAPAGIYIVGGRKVVK